ncbi:MAG: DUF3426 domain-containing protein [Burkholderiales bacterium]|jgi:predicted Zn finger-like uncharacterized protein
MDLFTRCPDCDTVFRVTTRHLQASGGQVRCGRCHSVFDAFASLTAKPPGDGKRRPDQPDVKAAAQQAGAVAPVAEETPSQNEPQTLTQTVRSPAPEAEPASRQEQPIAPAAIKRARSAGNTAADRDADAIEGNAEPQALAAPEEVVAVSDPAANLFEWEFKPAPALRRNGLWLALSLLLLICAIAQAGYLFRTELMVRFPQLKRVYELACQPLSCEIGLPRLADQLNIEASDLQFIDPGRPNLVQLTALVRNRARVPVEYPAFELTLTNAQQQVVARRIFMPDDYLENAARAQTGLGARQELAVNLYLDTGPLRAAGYRIYLFYPPPG